MHPPVLLIQSILSNQSILLPYWFDPSYQVNLSSCPIHSIHPIKSIRPPVLLIRSILSNRSILLPYWFDPSYEINPSSYPSNSIHPYQVDSSSCCWATSSLFGTAIVMTAQINGGHGVGGATKKKSFDDVVVNLSCVSTQMTGTVGSAKTDPFSAQKPYFGNCLQNPRPLYYQVLNKFLIVLVSFYTKIGRFSITTLVYQRVVYASIQRLCGIGYTIRNKFWVLVKLLGIPSLFFCSSCII